MSQNIDATLNRSTHNRMINDRTISVKNDNYLTAQQLLYISASLNIRSLDQAIDQ